MSAVNDLIESIRTTNGLLVMQKYCMSEEHWDSTLKGMAESLVANVCNFGTLTVAECTEVCDVINKSVLTDC